MGGRVCQREPNEIVLKFHLVAKLETRSGKGRKGMVRRSRSERERERRMEATRPTSKTTRARILKLVALGQNEGKSSVRFGL